MSTEQLSIPMLITAIVFALLGATLVWFGARRKKRYMYTLGTGFFVGAGVAVFVESAQIREILTAAAIVFAAFIAALSIDEARRLRKESVDKDNRDRRERLLNEIIEWARESAESTISRRTLSPEELWKAKLSYKFHKAKSKYILEIVALSFKDFSGLVEDINIKLDKLIEVTTEFGRKSMVGGKRLADYEAELTESVEKLFEETAKIKAKDIT